MESASMVLQYTELHARSAFSFLRGACVPEEYADRCSAFGQPAMALLDGDGVYGAPRFHLAMKKLGPKAYLGSEITCVDGARYPLLIASRSGY
jgi:error-prone DNA polymerase